MNASFLKLTPIVLLAALSTTQMVSGEQLENRITKLESQMRQVRTETALGTYTALTAPGRPQNDGSGLFATGDLLVWKLYEGSAYYPVTDSEYAFKKVYGRTTKEPLVNSNQIAEVNYRRLDFDWDVGFRAGIGFKSNHDNWDYSLTYTQFLTEESKTHNQDPPVNRTYFNKRQNLVLKAGFIPDTIPSDSTNSIYTRRSVDLYVADVELGRTYFVSKTLSLRPEFGVKSAWIYQKLSQTEQLNLANTFGLGVLKNENAIIPPSLVTTQLKGKNDFWGIGPQAGLEMNWYIVDTFSIYSEISGAVLWGKFDVRQKETSEFLGNVTNLVPPPVPPAPADFSANSSPLLSSKSGEINLVEHLKGGPHRFVPTVQMALGVAYSTLFYHDRLNVTVKAGYENQYWWRQNYLNGQALVLPDTLISPIINEGGVLSINGVNEAVPIDDRFASPDDLGYHGFTFELRVDF